MMRPEVWGGSGQAQGQVGGARQSKHVEQGGWVRPYVETRSGTQWRRAGSRHLSKCVSRH